MRLERVLSGAVLLSTTKFAFAEDLVFPFVDIGEAGADTDEFKDFHAQVMEVNNDLTTYSVGCATDPCAGWGNLPEFTYTVVIGPNTFDLKYSDEPFLSTRTACTFTGSPATEASCEMTNTGKIYTRSSSSEDHFTVPDETGIWNVMSATLKLVDGTAAPTPTGSGLSGNAPSSSITGTPAITGSRSGSANGGGPTPSSSQSTGVAQRTGVAAPWMLGVGIAAGAIVGV